MALSENKIGNFKFNLKRILIFLSFSIVHKNKLTIMLVVYTPIRFRAQTLSSAITGGFKYAKLHLIYSHTMIQAVHRQLYLFTLHKMLNSLLLCSRMAPSNGDLYVLQTESVYAIWPRSQWKLTRRVARRSNELLAGRGLGNQLDPKRGGRDLYPMSRLIIQNLLIKAWFYSRSHLFFRFCPIIPLSPILDRSQDRL